MAASNFILINLQLFNIQVLILQTVKYIIICNKFKNTICDKTLWLLLYISR